MLRYLRQVFSKFRLFPSISQLEPLMEEAIKPPAKVRGKTILEKNDFNVEVEIPVITINKNKVSGILPLIKKYCLKLEKLKPVQSINDNVDIYLNPGLVKDFSSFSSDVQDLLMSQSVNEECFRKKKVMFGYDNFPLESIFRAVLPPDKEGMSNVWGCIFEIGNLLILFIAT